MVVRPTSSQRMTTVKTAQEINCVKVCLYRTRPRLGGVREGMVKQTKVVLQSAKAKAEHDFSLFYLDQRRQATFAVAFCINRP